MLATLIHKDADFGLVPVAPGQLKVEPYVKLHPMGRVPVLEVDGTVIRDSASLERVPLYPTSFANHQNILSDVHIQEFLKVALVKGVKEAVASVPVRPRGKIRMADARDLSDALVIAARGPVDPAFGKALFALLSGNQAEFADDTALFDDLAHRGVGNPAHAGGSGLSGRAGRSIAGEH